MASSDQQPDHLVVNLSQNIQTFLENAEELMYFLRAWIDHRSTILEHLAVNGSSATGTISSVANTLSKFGSTVSGHLCGIDSKFGAATGIVSQALTLGFSSGLNKGRAEVNNRRLNYIYDDLQEDEQETKELEDLIVQVLSSLSALMNDLQSCTDLPPGHKTLQDITSALKNTTTQISDCRSPQYQAIVGWSDQISQLLQRFLTVLRQSNEPYSQISNLLERNPAPSVTQEIQEITQWVSALREGARAIEAARAGARQNAITADALLTRILQSGQSDAGRQIAASPASNVQTVGNSTSSGPSCPSQQPRGACSEDSTVEIERWFGEIRQIFEHSIEIANEVSRLINEEHIPLQNKRD